MFNLVEGLIDHPILHLHHVIERLGASANDYAFLASNVIFIAGGLIPIRSAGDDEGSRFASAPVTNRF